MKYWPVFALLIILLTGGCAKSTSEDKTAAELLPVASIAVLPVELPLDLPRQKEAAAELEVGQTTLNELFAEYFEGREGVSILSQGMYEGAALETVRSQADMARQIGRKAGVDAVMTSTIKRYVRRDAAQSQPASVSFNYRLLHVATGQVLCSGDYDVTQQAVLENVFTLPKAAQRKFKWITARELLKEGVDAKLGNCRYLRHEAKPTN